MLDERNSRYVEIKLRMGGRNLCRKHLICRDLFSFLVKHTAAVVNDNVQSDVRHAVLQLVDTNNGKGMAMHEDGYYQGNVVADLQIMVAKAIHNGVFTDSDELQIGGNKLDPSVVAWAESGTEIFEPMYRCNGDSMHHVSCMSNISSSWPSVVILQLYSHYLSGCKRYHCDSP